VSEYLDSLETELRSASSRRVLLEAARVPRPPASALAVGAAIVVCAVVVVVALGVSGRDAGRGPARVASRPLRISGEYRAAQALLAGIPQTGTVLGRSAAPVTVTLFGDLEAPISKDFMLGRFLGGFPQLVSHEVRSGTVKVVFRSFCTATCNGPGRSVFETQKVAAYAAGTQGLFWEYAELFYREQGTDATPYVTVRYLDALAKQIPTLNVARWQRARSTVVCSRIPATSHGNPICSIAPALAAQIANDARIARRDHVTGTPTIIVTGRKGAKTLKAALPSYSVLQRAIRHVQ
jgi:protein-disulfide isomerase